MGKFIPASEYCERVFDGTHDTPKPTTTGKPLVTSKHIVGGRLDLQSAYLISDEDHEKIQKRSKVGQWDLLFSMIGTVGEVYLESSLEVPYAVKNVGVFSCKDELKARWLYYFLRGSYARDHIRRYLNGAVQKFLPLGALRDFPILEYSPDQRGAVETLSTLDAKIDLNNRINAELEALAKTIYDYWFVQFDFPDENGRPYKSSGGAMVWNDTLKREIPAGWEVGPLGKWLNFQRGISYRSSEIGGDGAPLINLNSFRLDGSVKLDGTKKFSGKFRDDQRVCPGDLVIAITDVTRNADITGRAFVVPDLFGENPLISCDVAAVHSAPHLSAHYLERLFNSDYYHNYLRPFASGTLVLHLSLDGIRWFQSFLPPRPLIDRYDQIAAGIRNQINMNLAQNIELTQLRDWLLPLLMNGQVRVA